MPMRVELWQELGETFVAIQITRETTVGELMDLFPKAPLAIYSEIYTLFLPGDYLLRGRGEERGRWVVKRSAQEMAERYQLVGTE